MSLAKALNLSPQAKEIYSHIARLGSITAKEAMVRYGISSAALARRICDMEAAGFKVRRERYKNHQNGRQFTRYKIEQDSEVALSAYLSASAVKAVSGEPVLV